ncbi:MAG: glycosyltransferase [Anaerolineae bacterium]|nr:glycosyltransferase [Anaerolineae bacterium]
MKILYLIPDFPYPATGGGPLRVMGLLLGVAEAGHEVHVIAFGEEDHTDTPLHRACCSIEIVASPERSTADRLRTLVLSGQADMETRRWSEDFVRVLDAKLEQCQYDIIQCQSLEMTPYLLYIRERWPQQKLVYDAYNAEAELQRLTYETDRTHPQKLPLAMYSWIQWKRIDALEHQLGKTADAILAVSEIDQKELQKVAAKTPVYLVQNGIHVHEYINPPTEEIPMVQPSIIFTGIMDYRPNVDAAMWFATEILPHIPDAHLYIVGNRPHPQIQTLDAQKNITVTGFVEEVMPYLHQGTVFVVPMRIGSGTRLKMLQAMAAGCAIVSTDVGAAGLNVKHGEHLLLANNISTFAAAVNDLLHDPKKRRDLSANAQSYVREKFDWSVIVPRLLAVYDRLLS